MTNKLIFLSVSKPVAVSCLLTFFLFLSNCSPEKKSPGRAQIKETLRNADNAIQNAITHKNVDSLMIYYADDATLLPTAEPKIEGKAAIKKEWQHIFQIPGFVSNSNLTKVEISDDGSMAYTLGSYLATMQGEDGNMVQEPGKWVTIWKKQPDGRWKIIVDTYNTDVPPPDHK